MINYSDNEKTNKNVPICAGYLAIVGSNKSGKTAATQMSNFTKLRGTFNASFDFIQLGVGAQEDGNNASLSSFSEFNMFCDVILGWEDVRNLTDFYSRTTAMDSTIDSYIFTEQRQHKLPEDCLIAYLLPTFDSQTWVVTRGEKRVFTKNIALMSIIMGMLGVCRVSSATPTFFTLSGIKDTTLSGGLSSGYLDSLSTLSATASEVNSTVVLEIRDDFNDDDQKLRSATTGYIKLDNLKVVDYRYRTRYDDEANQNGVKFDEDWFHNNVVNGVKHVLSIVQAGKSANSISSSVNNIYSNPLFN